MHSKNWDSKAGLVLPLSAFTQCLKHVFILKIKQSIESIHFIFCQKCLLYTKAHSKYQMCKDELIQPHHRRDHDFREIVIYTIRNTVLKKEYYDLWKHEPKYPFIPLFIISILPQGQKTGWYTAKVQLFSEWYKLNYYLYTKYIDAHTQ